MNKLLDDLYNEILGNLWNIESINNKLNNMVLTLNQKENNKVKVESLMQNRTHIEELIEKISIRLSQLRLRINSFSQLERLIIDYYENV